jgi:alkaline phosphatase D
MKQLVFVFAFFGIMLLHAQALAQNLKAGPMIGHVAMMEAKIWLQTKAPATVQIAFWDTTGVGFKMPKMPKLRYSSSISTTQEGDHIAHFTLARLEPGTVYGYAVLLGGKRVQMPVIASFKTPKLWQWRTDPPEFTVAMGSCAYVGDSIYDRPGRSYGSKYEIFERIHDKRPDLMLWLGDNYYFREPDWDSETGMRYRAAHTRALPEMQALLATTQNYAIWDDHDYGVNDADRTYIFKTQAREIFQDYWANPTYGLDGKNGITTTFQYADIDFFLMDDRWFRTANKCKACPDRVYFGKEQMDWLIESLAGSFAPFKIVATGGQVLNSHKDSETYINMNETERAYLLKRIDEEKIKGVVFVTGDRHFAELSEMTNTSGSRVLDITASPLTAGVYKSPKDENTHRVPGTLVDQEHNFCLIKFSGKRKARKMEVSMCGEAGQVIWTKEYEEGK